jgi:predicted house-cleaning noncanonical NTP pyrophosphatase (MazG superfamily)
MNASDKIISEALDIAEFEEVRDASSDMLDDYEFARQNQRILMEKGLQALDKMMEVADMSQHPRSYEVVSTLINSLSTSNKDLLELSEKKKRIDKTDNKSGPDTVNNNLFIGSTAELQKLLKGS